MDQYTGTNAHNRTHRVECVRQFSKAYGILSEHFSQERTMMQRFSGFTENLKKGLALHYDLCYNP